MPSPTFDSFVEALKQHHHVEVARERMSKRVKGETVVQEYTVISLNTKEGTRKAIAYPLHEARTISYDEMRSVCRQLKIDVRGLDIGLDLGFPGGG